MVQLHKEFISLIDEAEKAAVAQRRRRKGSNFTFGDRLKPEAKEQLLALRRQLANN